jgi:hypothetical protein
VSCTLLSRLAAGRSGGPPAAAVLVENSTSPAGPSSVTSLAPICSRRLSSACGVAALPVSVRRSAAARALPSSSVLRLSSVPLPSARPASSALATLTSNQAAMPREANW